MSLINCNCGCRCSCSVAAVIVSAILGVLTAFLQITAVIILTPAFLWVVFGIGVAALGLLVLAAALTRRAETGLCLCSALNELLTGILGSILFAAVLLAVGIVATSVLNAIAVGTLLFFFSLTITSAACYVRTLSGCGN